MLEERGWQRERNAVFYTRGARQVTGPEAGHADWPESQRCVIGVAKSLRDFSHISFRHLVCALRTLTSEPELASTPLSTHSATHYTSKMTTTTMHFGPEWMRTKQGSARPAPSPPLANSPAPPGNSTYSALVTPATNPPPEGRDVAHPFRYSKEEMLRIYKEGGGRGGLGLEVERWEGIVREIGYEPVGLKEMSEAEKKVKNSRWSCVAEDGRTEKGSLSPL